MIKLLLQKLGVHVLQRDTTNTNNASTDITSINTTGTSQHKKSKHFPEYKKTIKYPSFRPARWLRGSHVSSVAYDW